MVGLSTILDRGEAVSLRFVAVTRWGDRAACIAAAASQTGAGLIVMARSRGRRLSRFLHRSLTGEVLEQAACPVLILSQPEGAGAAAASYRHIACAVESAGRDDPAIQWAAAFAQFSGSELTVIRYGAPPPEVLTAARRFRSMIDAGAGSIHRAAAAAVEELRPDLLVAGRALSTVRQLATQCRCPVVSVGEPGSEQRNTKPAGWKAA